MAARRNRSSQTLAFKTAELALAAPQVIAHRLTRFAQTAAAPSASDKREWMLMSTEKMAAFHESWFAISLELWRIQQRQVLALMTGAGIPWSSKSWGYSSGRAQRDAVALTGRALEPVRRRAVANAKRLGALSRR